jgi:hypothetical protein
MAAVFLVIFVAVCFALAVIAAVFESRSGRRWMRRVDELASAWRKQADDYSAPTLVRQDFKPSSGWLKDDIR